MIGHENKLKSNVNIQTNMVQQEEQQHSHETRFQRWVREKRAESQMKKQRAALVQETTHNEELRENIRRQGAAAAADGTAEGQPQQKQKPASKTFKKKSKQARAASAATPPQQPTAERISAEKEELRKAKANALVEAEKKNITDAENEGDLTFKAAQLAFNKLQKDRVGKDEEDEAILDLLDEIQADAIEESKAWKLVEAQKGNVTDAENEEELTFKAAYLAKDKLLTATEEEVKLEDALMRIIDKTYEAYKK